MSDRLAVFNEGRIEQIGPPAEVYEHPQSEFIAGFVGVSNVLERDGRRYTVRPEKITLLGAGEQPADRRTRRGGARPRRAVRRACDALPRYARPRRRAAGARAESRRRLERGARDEGASRARRVAAGTGVGHRRIGGRIGMNGRTARVAGWAGLGLLVAALCVVAAGCGGGGGGGSASTEIEGLGSSLDEIQANARKEGQVNLVIWAGYADKSWADAFTQADGLQGELRRTARARTTWSTSCRPARTTACPPRGTRRSA